MSALPPGGPNGQQPTPPPGAAPLRKRKPPPSSNPLVPRQKPKPRPAGVHAPGTPMHAAASKNAATMSKAAPEKTVQPRGIPTMQEIEAERRRNGGWSTPLPEGAEEFPVILTKKGTKDGLRFHVMKLAPPHLKDRQKGLDPSNQEDFVRPVTLHRRDPRQPPPGREVKVEEVAEPTPEQNEESQKLAQMKADREAQRAIDDAQKAPVMRDNAPKKNPKQKEKKPGTQVHYGARTEAQKKQNEIRYEEALPWHLEDADGKHVWVGQYENPLSESKVALAFQNGSVQMVPLEKWYKFISKRANVNALSIEEAEKVMSKKAPVSRWAMRDAQREQKEKDKAESRLIVNGAVNIKQESATFRSVSRREVQDHDDIDVSGDEFQDDDETAGFEPERDEDSKDSKDRVRREQLGANLFGDADETTVDKEEAKVKKEELERKLFGKDLKKALKRRDKQFQYDSDDSERERDPFASSSESDTDTEDEEGKKDEDKKDKDKDKDKEKEKEKDKEDGAGSKGSNTPQGKKSASSSKKGKSLKRAGSPGVSDSSGTESTRKKKAKTGPSTSSLAGSRSGTPLPRRPGPGSTSDGEATGGEMSDGVGGKMKKKQKLGGSHLNTGTNARGTPSGSRAASPAPQGARSPATPSAGEPITGAEIVAMLPPQGGVTIGALLGKFRNRVGDEPGQMPRGQWIKLVKEHSTYDPTTKLLTRKT